MNKLRQILFVIAAHCSIIGMGQTSQHGIIQEYNEKSAKTPLEGVELNVRSANSTVSDKNGAFELQFLTLKPGEKVNVRRIEKLGYEIFNKEAVEQWNISPTTPFVIVMCRSDRFKKIRDNYERVSSESYARQLKKEEAALAKLKSEGKLKEAEYEQQLNLLRENYENQLDNLDSYVDRFSRIDLSELSSAEQAIIELVQQGRIDEAIKAYEQQNYLDQYRQEVAEIKEIATAVDQLADIKTSKEQSRNSLLAALDRQIETLRLAGGKDNLDKMIELARGVADADTLDIPSQIRAARYITEYQSYPRLALLYLDKALRNATNIYPENSHIIAEIYDAKGDALSNTDNYQSLQFHENALKIYNKNPEADLLSKAKLYDDIGKNNYDIGRKQLVNQWMNNLAESNRDLFVSIKLNTDTLYEESFYKAIDNYLKSLEIKESISDIIPDEILFSLIRCVETYSKLGDVKNFIKARNKLGKYIADKSISPYNEALINELFGEFYWNKGNYEMTIEYFQRAADLWKEKYGFMHSNVRNCLQRIRACYYRLKNFEKAKEYDFLDKERESEQIRDLWESKKMENGSK